MNSRNVAVSMPAITWTVDEVLTCCPGCALVFTRLRMACVGCVMAPFETLGDVSNAYGLDPHAVLDELHHIWRLEEAKLKHKESKESIDESVSNR